MKAIKFLMSSVVVACTSIAMAQNGDTGACCFEEGCQLMPEEFCTDLGGEWQGTGSNCQSCDGDCGCHGEDANCGACCINGGCLILSEEQCASVLGSFNPEAHCEETECTQLSTACASDLNGDSIVDVTDLLEIISTWGTFP
jgi:hypothetical protein